MEEAHRRKIRTAATQGDFLEEVVLVLEGRVCSHPGKQVFFSSKRELGTQDGKHQGKKKATWVPNQLD